MKIQTLLYWLLFCTLPVHAVSSNIYKWTDKNNQVHFSGTPPSKQTDGTDSSQSNVEVIQENIKNTGDTNSDTTQESSDQSNTNNFAEIQSDAATPSDSDLRAAQQVGQQKLQDYCSTQKKRLGIMLANPLITITDDGKETLLSAGQRRERIDKLQLELQDRCNPKE